MAKYPEPIDDPPLSYELDSCTKELLEAIGLIVRAKTLLDVSSEYLEGGHDLLYAQIQYWLSQATNWLERE